MTTGYSILIGKLDSFIRKYYKNRVIRGVLLTGITLLSYIFILLFSEYYGHFSILVRTVLFYFSLAVFISVMFYFIISPLFKLYRIGKVISYKTAAGIISAFFPQVKDKLLNILELQQLNVQHSANDLLFASIDQKINDIKILPFEKAINLKHNFKYVRYVVLIAFIFLSTYLVLPNLFSESSARIINYNSFYEPDAPFLFYLITDTLDVEKGKDLTIKLKITGKYIPSEVFIEFGGNSFLMSGKGGLSKNLFSYTFRNINNSFQFRFNADNYSSKLYNVKVLPTPSVLNFKIEADVPDYTGESDKTYTNTGDVTVPFGTKLKFEFSLINTDSLFIQYLAKRIFLTKKDDDKFSTEIKALQSFDYSILGCNEFFEYNKLISYSVTVIPDLFPAIVVEYLTDSINKSFFYYKGEISDDYGFTKLYFNYRKTDKNGTPLNRVDYKSIPIEFSSTALKQDIFFSFDFGTVKSEENEFIQYYFEVFDNDAVSGFKSSKTKIFEFHQPTQSELTKLSDKANESIQDKLKNGVQLANEIQNDIQKMQQKSFNENTTAWEKTRMLNQILDKQSILEKLIDDVRKENKMKDNMLNSFSEQQKEILEKQKQIEDMLKNLMTDEMKQMLEEINKLQQQFNQQQFNQMSEKMKMNYEDLSKQLDRNLEMIKKFEVEQKITNAVDRLDKLSENMEKLSEKTENKSESREDLKSEQKNLSEEFENIMKDYQDALDKNNELQNKYNLDDFKDEKQAIEKELNDAKENLDKGKENKASKSQKSASEKQEKLSEDMEAMLTENMQQESSENEDDLRKILDNLVTFSFEQENLAKKSKEIYINDPKYQDVIGEQKKLVDDFSVIDDSLTALAKRVPQVNSTVSSEISKIKSSLNQSLKDLNDRKNIAASKNQQFAMTSANNLALMLSEVLDAMQNQPNGQGKGNSKPNKKSKGQKPSFGEMKSQQESLKKQLEQMLQMMKNGEQQGQEGMNQRLAQMLSQQEIFEKMIRDLKNNSQLKPETNQQLNEINKLNEENKNDLINKNISPETLIRQQEILTKLLDAEKSERNQEFENKRESKDADDKNLRSPEEMFKLNKKSKKNQDDFTNGQLKLNNYYKQKYEYYLQKIEK